jgi:tetratricopeptide (TPR) repeat protein
MAEAESLYAVAQDVFTRTVGPDDRRTLLARQRRITIVRVRDVGLAEAEARALLADAERALGPDDPFTANLPFHLGDYVALQRPDDPEAEWWFREGIARVERRSGRRTLELIHGLHSLAEARILRGDYAEAESLLQRSLGINEALLGPAHAGTAGALGTLASLYERTNRLAEAEQVRLEVLRRFESALGPGHSDVAEAKARLARVAYRKGDYARAEQLWRESIDIAERALGPEHASVLRSQLQLAAVLQAMGRTAEATRLCQQGTTTINRLYPMAPVQQEVRAESPHCVWDDLPDRR